MDTTLDESQIIFEDWEVENDENSPDQVETTTTVEELLISCVQARPPLWNCRLPLIQRSKTIRDELWLEIFREFGEQSQFSLEFLTKKWRNLRDTYVRIKGEQESQSKSGSRSKKKRKWMYYDHLVFLNDTLEYRVTTSNYPPEGTSSAKSPFSPLDATGEIEISKRKKAVKKTAESAIIDALSSISKQESMSHLEPIKKNVNQICLRISEMLETMPKRERAELEITLLQTAYEGSKRFL